MNAIIDQRNSESEEDLNITEEEDLAVISSLSPDPEEWGTELKVAVCLCLIQCFVFYCCW